MGLNHRSVELVQPRPIGKNQLNNQLEVRTTSTFFTLQEFSQQNSEKGPPNYITETLGPRLLNHC